MTGHLKYAARRFTVPIIVLVMVGAVFQARALEFIERELIDLRFSTFSQSVGPDIAVVAIDPKSLSALGAWPWPRARHAAVISNLYAHGARRVAIDIDLSSKGSPADDGALAQALAEQPGKTILAAFAQQDASGPDGPTQILSAPLETFQSTTDIAAIALRPDADGLIRRLPLFENTGRTFIPVLSTVLAAGALAAPSLYYADMTFDVRSIPVHSYVDVLNNTVPDEAFRGRQVIIGATSSQLGTHLPIPGYRALPATLFHVIGAQSLINDRALQRPTGLFTLSIVAILAFLLWRANRPEKTVVRLGVLCGIVIVGSLATSFAAFTVLPILLDTTPWILTALLIFLAGIGDRLRSQSGHLNAYEEIERRRAEIERRLLEAMESFGEAFAMYDPNDRLIVCNSAFRRLHGETSDVSRPGTTFEHILDTAVRTGLFELEAAAQANWKVQRQRLLSGTAGNLVHTIQVRDGRWLRIVDQRTSDDGFITVLFDVTDAMQRERALALAKDDAELANHAKSEFLANMSHELRTPLNAVIGFSDLMLHEVRGKMGNPDYMNDVRAIHESATHLLSIISDILDLSRIEAGTLVLNESEVDVGEILQSVRNSLKPAADEIELKVDLEVEPGLPGLWADARLMKQIITNLLSNAIKFSPAGERIRMTARLTENGEMEIAVSDQGIGISEAEVGVVFEAFGQIENAMTRSHEGVGLGLPLSRTFCEAMGANLLLNSEKDRGTTVVVRFPVDRIREFRAAGE